MTDAQWKKNLEQEVGTGNNKRKWSKEGSSQQYQKKRPRRICRKKINYAEITKMAGLSSGSDIGDDDFQQEESVGSDQEWESNSLEKVQPCKYGKDCYQTSKFHKQNFSH